MRENTHRFKNLKLQILKISIIVIFTQLQEELKYTVVFQSCKRSGIILITGKGVTHSPPTATCRQCLLDLHGLLSRRN